MRLEDTHCHSNYGRPHKIQAVRNSREPINPSFCVIPQKPHNDSLPYADYIELFECELCGRQSKFNKDGEIAVLMGKFKG